MAAPVVPSLRSELVVALKRLKLGRIVDTLPERLVLADKQDMTFDDLLLLVVTDEITRRDQRSGAGAVTTCPPNRHVTVSRMSTCLRKYAGT